MKIFGYIILIVVFLSNTAQAQQNQDELLASQFLQNKEYDKALVLYEKLFESKPGYYYYVPLITCLVELKEFDKAEKIIKKQLKKNDENFFYKVDLGYIYGLTGDYKKKDKHFESIISSLLPLPQNVNDLAAAFVNRNEYDWAIKTYLHARKTSKGEYGYYTELADLYLRKGDVGMMIEQYIQAITSNPEMLVVAQNALQDLVLNDPKGERTEYLKKQFLKKIQANPNETIFSEMLIWLMIQIKDFETAFVQVKSLDKRLKENGYRFLELGKTCTSNEDYNTAMQCYNQVIEKGKDNPNYITAKLELATTLKKKITSVPNYTQQELLQLEELYKYTLEELGKNSSTVYLIKDYADLLAFYLNKPAEAIALLEEIIAQQNINIVARAECKIELADVYVLTGEVWEATLLYSQVEKQFKNEPLGHQAKFKNAQLSYFKGDFFWAQAQLDVLKAATSKLIANDALQLSLIIIDNQDPDSGTVALEYFARADLYILQHKYDSALAMYDSIKVMFLTHPIFDEILFRKAEIMEKTGKYKEAAELYQNIVNVHGDDILGDDALFRLAQLYEKVFKDNSKAMELYQELLVKYPGSVFTVEARKRFRTLRGDNVN